ncbi:hypothetical protein [Streptomyces sporangiiformans]|nr:hypothetical protein [Streptomyces sporangiiformans]
MPLSVRRYRNGKLLTKREKADAESMVTLVRAVLQHGGVLPSP